MTDKSWLYSKSADELAAELEVVEAELATLKELVREVYPAVLYVSSIPPEILPFKTREYRGIAMEFINRPEVKALIDGE